VQIALSSSRFFVYFSKKQISVGGLRESWRKVQRLPAYLLIPTAVVAMAMLTILWPLSVEVYTVLLPSSKLPSFCHWWVVKL